VLQTETFVVFIDAALQRKKGAYRKRNISSGVLYLYLNTSGFWPRVRARALRAPVFLDSLPRPTGRSAPPRPSQLRCSPKINKIYRTLSLEPPHRSFADPSGNIVGSKLCTGATLDPNFFVFSFYYIIF
jgi:hypothetical protein